MKCENAVALVTGAAKRVGRAIALELAAAGCDVAIHYHHSEADAGELVERIEKLGRRAIAVRGDLATSDVPACIVATVRRQLGGLDVLVNNASVFVADPEGGFDPAHWPRVFQINTFAPAALIAAAEDALIAGGRGKVVNLCDISADRPWKNHMAYCASKAALINVTRSAARRLAPHVQVNGVSPGIAVFPDNYDEKLREKLVAKVPLHRPGSPADIANAVRFLVEQADYVTGQIINVDGGRSIVG